MQTQLNTHEAIQKRHVTLFILCTPRVPHLSLSDPHRSESGTHEAIPNTRARWLVPAEEGAICDRINQLSG
ncbi:hypothetical protein BO70DRAFT_366054 [Aspergillus heteromorphus CBS 117.55]|uniref:Uncharacterized protein n=1 Tax=Aspergillus heteromorphus CBS 117.55 TaxID=1448321 RepID=A0A317URN0_9EURO|nr:uncharacterized protein BO70DRAFT_367212 [Aspergillus heteromorphus CBS 117.55]XP_025394275.1 uncharacterized protein BO70DRAFT_367026 [Aspergillus heteromorphus CBS 117.55]XP_025394518.1 uncharacterized protein BO70DRAFT_366793 [Aspergillus heteromorphus CBS 117.55]XP_025395192.1 uncharacterized protein BO70DRAFT_366054 [Aspergillus heteromorphus CBS 117.55]PWY62389.1 hypothetical protein BO70DRAFT_367212 [Aspergillus heteromorphus CBS 117.55]PWY64311.1 hypothetical protein BO70DRAFT_36702